ncbi:MAG TPA: hypothetical protein VGK54_18970 [Chloroflexota bacterium]
MAGRTSSGLIVASPVGLRLAGWLDIAFALVSLAELPFVVQSIPTPPIWTITLDTLRPLAYAYTFWVFKDLLRRRFGATRATGALWVLVVVGILQVLIQGTPLWSSIFGITIAFPVLSIVISALYGLGLIGLGVTLLPRDLYGLTKPLGILLIVAGLYPLLSVVAAGPLLAALTPTTLGPVGAIYVVVGLGSTLVAAPMVVLGALLLRAARS